MKPTFEDYALNRLTPVAPKATTTSPTRDEYGTGNLKKAIDFAKKNPDHPDSVELRRRLETGQLNFELRSLGMKEIPVQKPKVDMAALTKEPAPMTEVPKEGFLKETGKDLGQMFQGLGESVGGMVEGVKDIATNDNFNIAQKAGGISGKVAGGISSVIGDVVIGGAKVLSSQEQEDAIKGIVQKAATGVAQTEIAKDVVNWYENLDENDKLVVDSAGGIASLMADVFTGGAATKVGGVVTDATIAAAKKVPEVLETGVNTVAKGFDTVQDATRASRLAKQEAKVDEAVGRIIQGKPEDIVQAKKALTELETDGVRTYADMNERVDDTIEALSKKQDVELGQYTEKYTADTLGKYTKVGDKTVVQSPVSDALDGLENAYRLSGEAPKAEAIVQLRQKLTTEGLTVQELNKIAKEYGIEYKQRSFDKMGNPKAGYNAESFENIRKGVKDVIRERLPDEKSKAIDESISNMYALRDLTGNMETKVQKLYQRIKNRTLAQKVGGAVADVVDLVSMGTLRGFIQKLLPSNVGLKTANAIDLEKELAKNLKEIDKLLEIKDEKKFSDAVKKYMEETQPGMSTRVTSGLTNAEKDNLLGKLNAVKSTDVTADTPTGASSKGYLDELDLELFTRLEELKKTADTRSLTEREYAELKVLMDEMELNTNQTIAPSFNSGEIPEKLRTQVDELMSKKEGEMIERPDEKIQVSSNAQFSRKTLKHFLESRTKQGMKNSDIEYLLSKAPEVTSSPEINIKNPSQKYKDSSLLGRYYDDSNKAVMVVLDKGGNVRDIITLFFTKRKDFENLKELYG